MDKLEAINGGWAADIIETAKATQEVQPVYKDEAGTTLVVAISKDQKLEKLDLARYQDSPRRICAHLKVAEVTSFIDYWQLFAGDGAVIHADMDDRTFTAIFDNHQPGKPAWQEHLCTLRCKTTKEWDTWSSKDGKAFSQVEFAHFIEMNAIDIIDPAAAVMLEVAMTLQANKKVKFSSGVRLDNGQVQLGYHEDIDGSAGKKGELKVPDKFKLALRIFQGGEKYGVEAHLRWRIDDGRLSFFYQIVRPERLLEDAFDQVKKQVATGCTGATILAVA